MRINIQGLNMEVSAELRRQAEGRLWMAAHRSPRRAGWTEVLLERDEAARSVKCQVDAWVRGIGHVSARGVAADALAAVDLAALRLEQAIVQCSDRLRLPNNRSGMSGGSLSTPHARSSVFRANASTADRARRGRAAATTDCPFLDYDPVGLPL